MTETTDNNVISLLRFACCTTKATDTHTEYVCNAYCWSTATMVTRTHLNLTFIRTLPVL